MDGYKGFLLLDKDGKPKVAMHLEHVMKRLLDKYNATHEEQLPRITPHSFGIPLYPDVRAWNES